MAARYPSASPAQRLIAVPISPIAAFPPDVYAAAQRVCQDFHAEGIPAMAAKMGVPAGTLYNKLNPHETSHHKLTVQDLGLITLISGDYRALQAYCRTLNAVCFPVPDLHAVSDAALLELVAKVHEQCGAFHAELRKSLEDGKFTPQEFARMRARELEWIGAIVEATARLEGLVRG